MGSAYRVLLWHDSGVSRGFDVFYLYAVIISEIPGAPVRDNTRALHGHRRGNTSTIYDHVLRSKKDVKGQKTAILCQSASCMEYCNKRTAVRLSAFQIKCSKSCVHPRSG